jgi:hypothetical protein
MFNFRNLCLAIGGLTLGLACIAGTEDLMRMTQQLDQLDKIELNEALDKAASCTRTRDFACAEKYLVAASKYPSVSGAKTALKRAQDTLASEKAAAAEEQRLLARRQRELEKAEERLAEQERVAAQSSANDDQGMSTAQGVALFGQLLNQSLANQAAFKAADNARAAQMAQQRAQAEVNQARDQQRLARDRATLADQIKQQREQQEAAQRARQVAEQQRLQVAAVKPQPEPAAATATKSYPGLPRVQDMQWDSTVSGKKNGEAWCVKWTQEIRNNFKTSKNDLISMGQCSCELSTTSPTNHVGVFEREYFCKFKYTYRQNVPDNSR